jgi:HEAT repeat protein
LRLDQESLSLRVELVDTITKLAEAGAEAYVPILERLLRHEDPNIRRSAVTVTVRICGPQGRALVEPLANDKDESVRSAVKKAMDQFPGL